MGKKAPITPKHSIMPCKFDSSLARLIRGADARLLLSCAIGANLALAGGEYLDLPEPASEFFSSRAKALLDIEMDSPTVATVQALVVMSASEAAFTRDARGWLYSGMWRPLPSDPLT